MRRPSLISPIETHLGYWLRIVSNGADLALSQAFKPLDVTTTEWVMLRRLFGCRGGLAPSEIAEDLGLTRGAITRLSDRLIEKALIVRRENPQDRRFQILALTEKGNALVVDLAKLADKSDARFFGRLSDKERNKVEASLRRLILQKAPRGSAVHRNSIEG